jgi:hypothetical protein
LEQEDFDTIASKRAIILENQKKSWFSRWRKPSASVYYTHDENDRHLRPASLLLMCR